MAINFPDSPSVNQVHTVGQRKWRWNGEKWRKVQADVPSALPSLTVDGDLTVHGTTTTLSAEQLRIEDNIITLNDGQTGTPTLHAGVEVERGDADNSAIRWNETDDRWEYSADSTTYYPISYQPSGSISLYGGATAPTGWLLCDGSAVSRTTYAELFAVVGTTYGVGDGSTTFNVPSLSGKVPVGLDSTDTDFDALGETGGTKTHTLTSAEVPSHNHNAATNAQSSSNTGNATNTYTGGSLNNTNAAAKNNTGNNSGNHTHGGGTTSAHNINYNHSHNNNSQSANHYHGTNAVNLDYNHSHGTGDGNKSFLTRENIYTNEANAFRVDGIGTHNTQLTFITNTNSKNLNYNHSHGNTGNISANHSHNTSGVNLDNNHSHNTNSTGNQSANHYHGFGHKHNHDHTHNIDHTHTVSLGNSGSGGAHTIVQPYIVLNYIIKA